MIKEGDVNAVFDVQVVCEYIWDGHVAQAMSSRIPSCFIFGCVSYLPVCQVQFILYHMDELVRAIEMRAEQDPDITSPVQPLELKLGVKRLRGVGTRT